MKATLVTCLAAATLLIAGGRWALGSDDPEHVRKSLERATISLSAAVEQALAQIPDSKAVEASLETKHDNTTFEIEVVAHGKHRIVEVDPTGGAVEKKGGESIEENQQDASEQVETQISRAPVTLVQAVKAALEQEPHAKACRVEPKKHDGRLVFSVELLAQRKLVKVLVDATSCEIVPHGG
ncbi:MAG TPA: PepSY domain-containing protein [Pirellulales bacterium]